ncbi:hypothetical protein JMY81_15420 [Brenneria goodwinii]|uniref:hypothetical protein n=1 Tax=Brenneria goodwinii TaxID=1109412 RepID=UPI00069CF28B|nr:hypothetical protein [Brenneria goodwinii]MCG8157248.1 hypothetical protein [Brenneria goodwinii]MCG8162202.1 hypothetical protein [Brenneria goodwinii]MCG8166132.1 hypothetical protein [Brenneria goodwinii]MCG8170759.1 hypothetical protein [Brenneria goodwinii]MCG8175828.1 hypothetical protein [Brenneria goodwinii]
MKAGKIIAQGEPSAIITSSSIRETFGLDIQIIDDPITGTPLVLPLAGNRKNTGLLINNFLAIIIHLL